MIDLKRERMGEFIWNARSEIESLWNELMTGEDERADFAAFVDGRYHLLETAVGMEFSFRTDEHTEDLLSQHEHEIARLKAEVRLKMPMLASIKKYFDICEEEKELERAAGDQTRLLGRGGGRDPGRLLREEKMRKRVGKEKPKVCSRPRLFTVCLIARRVAGTAITVVPSRMGAGQWSPLPGARRKYAPDSDGECIRKRTREQEEDDHIAILGAST